MCEGRKFLLASKNALINSRTGERVINGVFKDATETGPGCFPMVLLHIDKDWKRGGEAKWYEPNGEYDYFMREQNGILTPHKVLSVSFSELRKVCCTRQKGLHQACLWARWAWNWYNIYHD